MKKRLFTILAVLVMVVCLTSVTAFANGYFCYTCVGVPSQVNFRSAPDGHFAFCGSCSSPLGSQEAHVVNSWTYNNDATCTGNGTKSGRCAKCGANVTIDDPKHPATGNHTWENGECKVCHTVCTNHSGGEATCTAAAVCEVCEQSYGNTDQNNHSGTEEWTKTTTTHEKKWSCCNAVVVASEDHEWENGVCSECGYECTHSGGEATCTAAAVCTVCGQSYGDTDQNNHSGTEEWTKTTTTHEKKWSCCNAVVVASEDHEWENGVCSECGYECTHSGGEATCTAAAVCTVCGQPYGDTDQSKHSGTLEWKQTATTHKQVYNCCQAENVAETEHTWENGKCKVCDYVCLHPSETAATCTAKARCETCGKESGDTNPNNHSDLKHFAKNAATTSAKGNIEYWYCDGCKQYFKDEKATQKIENGATGTEIPKLPAITKGGDQTVTAGEKTALTFTSDAAFAEFVRVEIDGVTLDEKNYTVKEGSTIVTLNADYVAALAAGEHTLDIVSQSGTATAKFTVAEKTAATTDKTDKPVVNDKAKAPKTGDSGNGVLWLALLLVSGGAVTAATLVSGKKKYNR